MTPATLTPLFGEWAATTRAGAATSAGAIRTIGGRAVVQAAAERFGWQVFRRSGARAGGRGLALTRYKIRRAGQLPLPAPPACAGATCRRTAHVCAALDA